MGECGCAAQEIDFKLEGPGEYTYGIEYYRGCRYCGLGPAIGIYRLGSGDLGHRMLEHVPEAQFSSNEFQPVPVQTIDLQAIKEDLTEALTGTTLDEAGEVSLGDIGAELFVEEYLMPVLRKSLRQLDPAKLLQERGWLEDPEKGENDEV